MSEQRIRAFDRSSKPEQSKRIRNLQGVGGFDQDVDANDKVIGLTDVPPNSMGGAHPSTDFDAFYLAEFARTVRLARLLSGSPADAEDLAQEAFVRVHRHAGALINPGGFLRTATVNVCHNWHRTRKREALRLVRHGPSTQSLSLGARELDAVIAAFPYRQRAVLVLRYWLDLSEADIARTLGCRPGTVKSLHARALTRLRKELPE